VEPPKRGRRFTDAAMKEARKAYRSFARHYHPDRHGGDETLRPQFEAVIHAWTVIDTYQGEHPE
jgi:curved DNA-binding protein CbpA